MLLSKMFNVCNEVVVEFFKIVSNNEKQRNKMFYIATTD